MSDGSGECQCGSGGCDDDLILVMTFYMILVVV